MPKKKLTILDIAKNFTFEQKLAVIKETTIAIESTTSDIKRINTALKKDIANQNRQTVASHSTIKKHLKNNN